MKNTGAVLGLLAVGLTSPAIADCGTWNISGEMTIQQSNNIPVRLDLVQNGERLTGTARFYSTAIESEVGGPLEGFLNGNNFHFRVNWFVVKSTCFRPGGLFIGCTQESYKEHGVYEGTINQNGEINGATYPFERPNARANFFATRLAACGDNTGGGFSSVPGAIGQVIGTVGGEPIDSNSNVVETKPIAPINPNTRFTEFPDNSIAVDPAVGAQRDLVNVQARDLSSIAGGAAGFSGTYETTFGDMQLDATGGMYSYNGGRLAIEKVTGNVVEGTWTENGTSNTCPGGKPSGPFRFTFSQGGFTGVYGNCGEQPTRAWDGQRK